MLLKEDAELLTKGLRITLPAAGAATSAPPAGVSAAEATVELTELADELRADAGDATSPEDVAARWADVSSRRSLFDRALVGRLSTSEAPVADYLIGSFSRIAEMRSRKGSQLTPELGEVYAYVSELCISYCSIALLNPSMFPQPADAEAEGVLRLLGPLRTDSLPSSFLSRLVARLQEEGTLSELAVPLFAKLWPEKTQAPNILGDFAPHFRALHALVKERPLGALLASDANFLPFLATTARSGNLLEAGSRLGPFLGISCFPNDPALAAQFFPDTSAPSALEMSMSSLRMSTGIVQNMITSVAKELFKNPDAKEPFFKYIAAACTLNGSRAQQWFPHAEGQRLLHAIAPEAVEAPTTVRTYSQDGFMLNLASVLLRLCDPFTAPNSPHAAKIDATYLLSTHRLALKDETRLCATADDVMYWLDPRNEDLRRRYLDRLAEEGFATDEDSPPLEVSTSFGTISEYFFLTMRVLHVGMLASFSMLEKLGKEHQRWAQDVNVREQEIIRLRHAGPEAAGMVAALEQEIAKLKKWIDGIKQCILCYQTQLGDPSLVSMCVRYYRLVSRWLVATAKPPAEGLPLPEKVPRLFAALPEFCMSDIADFLKNVTHLAPQAFEQIAPDELYDFITLMVTFIGSPKYVKNPYLRATFTKLLCYLVPRDQDDSGRRHASERLAGVFHSHPLAQRHLAPAIMQFFVDIEFTGSHTSAHDKYETRHEMTQILEYFWATPIYKEAMIGFARDVKKFVRFVNMLINDSIHAMNEALTKLATIKDTQTEMADEATWAQQAPRVRQQRAQQHQQAEGHARYFMLFTNEVLHMLQYLSSDKEVAQVFMLPELAPRMAAMLNHFLVELVGPKCSNLKVKDMDKYNFNPKRLLAEIISTILHFTTFQEFELAMVKDERSFEPGNLRKAVRVLSRSLEPMLRPDDLACIESFASRCVEVKQQEEDNEAELGEIPDEFQDPITAELMLDPVKLPSGHSIDRPTITRHLLSDETDPFSRARCTVEMLVDDPELKERIAAWKLSRKAAIQGGSSGVDPMEEG